MKPETLCDPPSATKSDVEVTYTNLSNMTSENLCSDPPSATKSDTEVTYTELSNMKPETLVCDPPRETKSDAEKMYNEHSLTRTEKLFCRRCALYCNTRDEFNLHVFHHTRDTSLSEGNKHKESFMSYINIYVCPKCGQEFEVKSALIIHYNTVCFDGEHFCKHCRENCMNTYFLQMHLYFHHNYTEKMFFEEGFLTKICDNPYFLANSFMMSSKRPAFPTLPLTVENEFDNIDSSSLAESSNSRGYSRSRKSAFTHQNLAFNLLDKAHTCEVCSESFSRKCVLDIHAQKHVSAKARQKIVNHEVLVKDLSMDVSEKNCALTPNTMQIEENSINLEVPEIPDNEQTVILKPPNVLLCSPASSKVKPKRKFRRKKFSIGRFIRKRKNNEIFPAATQNSRKINATPQSGKETTSPPVWKGIKLGGRVRITASSNVHKNSKNLIKMKKSKSSKTKQCKEILKTERNQVFMCEFCKKYFKDGYKLRRHLLIHTGVRPYTCPKCKKSFTRDDHLKRHIKKVCSKTGNSQTEK